MLQTPNEILLGHHHHLHLPVVPPLGPWYSTRFEIIDNFDPLPLYRQVMSPKHHINFRKYHFTISFVFFRVHVERPEGGDSVLIY